MHFFPKNDNNKYGGTYVHVKQCSNVDCKGITFSKSNGLDGIIRHEIDEITQIISLIKRIISDGIQRSDIHKIITLLGEMMELMPEFEAEIKAVIKGLKALYKRLFDSDMVTHDSHWNKYTGGGVPSTTQDIGEKGMLSDVEIINQLTPDSKRPDESWWTKSF